MKKLMMVAALAFAAIAYAEEEAAPAEAAVPQPAPQCESKEGAPCKCGDEKIERKCGEFKGPRHGHHGMHHRGMQRGEQGVPRFVKCNCCPDCKGLILLPPAPPAFENGKRPECGKGPCGMKKGPCGMNKGPEKPGCPCGKGAECDCPKPAAE